MRTLAREGFAKLKPHMVNVLQFSRHVLAWGSRKQDEILK